MRIQKLIIRGFGPYADKIELDFDNSLMDKNMFVITGNTGAGKTTIFDAINFVLYGEASGSDRDGKSLRSDFAGPETPTEVELLFSLRGEDYYVKRNPAYQKPKVRGDGYTEQAANAEFKNAKGKTITGAGNVTKEVEAVLGITTKQFKQLVMIPQGEFKQLLGAKSDEKEEIFRKIFGTELFERIERGIWEQANTLEKAIKRVSEERAGRIRSFECIDRNEELFRKINAEHLDLESILKDFEEFIKIETQEQAQLKESLLQADLLINKISSEVTLAEENNKKLDILERNRQEVEKLEQQLAPNEQRKSKLDKAKRAAKINEYESKYNEKHEALKKLAATIEALGRNIESFRGRNEAAEREIKIQLEREDEKNKLIKDIAEQERLMKRVSDYEDSVAAIEVLSEAVNATTIRIKEIESTIGNNDHSLLVTNEAMEAISKDKEEKARLDIVKSDCGNRKEKLESLKSALRHVASEKAKHAASSNDFEQLELVFKKSKEFFEHMDEAFRRGQAGILANGLRAGQPCPVCGSLEHPKPALLENSEITEQTVKKSAEQLESDREKRDRKLNELTQINTSIKSTLEKLVNPLIAELMLMPDGDDPMSIETKLEAAIIANDEELARLKSKLNELAASIDKLSGLQSEKENLEKANKELRLELQKINSRLGDDTGKLSAAQNTMEQIRREFDGEIRSAKEIEMSVRTMQQQQQLMKQAYEQADNEYNRSKTLLNQEEGKLDEANRQQDKLKLEHKAAVEEFKQKSLTAGFQDYPDYKSSCMSEQDMNSLELELNKFNTSLSIAKSHFAQSQTEAQGLVKIDTAVILEKQREENDKRVALQNEDKILFARIKNNTQVLETCNSLSKLIEKDEQRYRVIGSLAAITNGSNSKNISFERYVLAEYFEDIIKAANLRFTKMTNGRFELLRKQDIGDKRKGQGLDMEVFDNYTGKARDVKTLSGGESFKASLSLALGLADVVQENAGGIQLDTMFIDEGFGTLDPESLDNAIECLMELQNDGRLVGLISHVPELKERIGVRLEVNATSRGSRAEFVV